MTLKTQYNRLATQGEFYRKAVAINDRNARRAGCLVVAVEQYEELKKGIISLSGIPFFANNFYTAFANPDAITHNELCLFSSFNSLRAIPGLKPEELKSQWVVARNKIEAMPDSPAKGILRIIVSHLDLDDIDKLREAIVTPENDTFFKDLNEKGLPTNYLQPLESQAKEESSLKKPRRSKKPTPGMKPAFVASNETVDGHARYGDVPASRTTLFRQYGEQLELRRRADKNLGILLQLHEATLFYYQLKSNELPDPSSYDHVASVIADNLYQVYKRERGEETFFPSPSGENRLEDLRAAAKAKVANVSDPAVRAILLSVAEHLYIGDGAKLKEALANPENDPFFEKLMTNEFPLESIESKLSEDLLVELLRSISERMEEARNGARAIAVVNPREEAIFSNLMQLLDSNGNKFRKMLEIFGASAESRRLGSSNHGRTSIHIQLREESGIIGYADSQSYRSRQRDQRFCFSLF